MQLRKQRENSLTILHLVAKVLSRYDPKLVVHISTVVPIKSDSDVILCLQLLCKK